MLLDAEETANCFANCFEYKTVMSGIKFTMNIQKLEDAHAVCYCGMPTVNAIEKALHSVHKDSALEIDSVLTKISKRCSHVFAPMLHKLIVTMLALREASAVDNTLSNVQCLNAILFMTLQTTGAYT